MFRDRKKLPVFEEDQLDEILSKIGLLESFKDGEIACHICGEKISKNNLGAIVKENELFNIICTKSDCLLKIKRGMKNGF